MEKVRETYNQYPSQFWLLFLGMLISFAGSSMIWPYLMIYASGRLGLPLAAVASLMTLRAASGLIASFIAGPVADRLGRKSGLTVGLAGSGLIYLAMIPADTYPVFALLMILRGAFEPLYRVSADAMVADLIPDHQRAEAYAMTRLAKNLGIAIGPVVGGAVATISYGITFTAAASGLLIFGLLTYLFVRETLPAASPGEMRQPAIQGYRQILGDRMFMALVLAFTLTQFASSMIWVLMSVYAKEHYGVLENRYGLIAMTNALMVVTLQVYVTRKSKPYPPHAVLALGALLYAAGTASVALATGFWGFWLSMVVLTSGELLLVPTATTLAANLAPADLRGRYMSIFALSWGVASGVAPLMGGYLNDAISPQAIWYGGGLMGLLGAVWFLLQQKKHPSLHPVEG